jgi:hypothetical protein
MSTRSKTEKAMLRQAVPGKSTPPKEAETETPAAPEPIAQWKDNIGDRLTYLFWLACFGLLAFHVLAETIVGFFNKR